MKKTSKKKLRRRKEKAKALVVQSMLGFFVIIVPISLILLYALGAPIPELLVEIYSAVTFVIGGILLIVFCGYGDFGLAKKGDSIGRFSTTNARISAEDAMWINLIFGIILTISGILFAVFILFKIF